MNSKWNPIATAPKDVNILICAEYWKEDAYEIFLAEYSTEDDVWYVPGAHGAEGWVDLYFTPVLWMPAPDTPEFVRSNHAT
jgi:hypothetical protein